MDSAVFSSTEGTKNTVAPARSTAMVFSATPPTSPTLPCGSIVPVAATIRWPVRRPLLSLSMMPSVMARPADGPPMSWVCTVTLTGNCQSCCVWGSMPRKAVGLVGAPQPVSVSPLGGAASVTDLWTVGPGTKSPTSLMEDSSTLSETLVPGASPCSASTRAQSVGVAVAFDRGDHLGHLQRLGGGGAGLDPVR